MIVNARKKAGIATRREQALKLFFEGNTMRQVAEKLECSLGTVSGDINAELQNYGGESREALRMQKLEELAALKASWRERARSDIAAAGIYTKILALECKTLGIDAAATKNFALFAKSEPEPLDFDYLLREMGGDYTPSFSTS